MVKAEIQINKDNNTVWQFIETELCRAFNTNSKNLLGAQNKHHAYNFLGKEVEIIQEVTSINPLNKLSFISYSNKDAVVTTYELVYNENYTIVILSEEGKGLSSNLRSWNFILMSLPILRNGSKKKLLRQLLRLKNALE